MPAQVFGQVEKLADWRPMQPAVGSSFPAPQIDILWVHDGTGYATDLEQERGQLWSGMLEGVQAGIDNAAVAPVQNVWDAGSVWAIPGPCTGLGPRGYRRSDRRILDDVCERLTRHGQLDASDIEVGVEHGTVTLHGAVAGRSESRMAAATAGGVTGVVEVINWLRFTD